MSNLEKDEAQRQHELFLERLRLSSEHNRSTVPLVQATTQGLLVLNGGALTALLALIGALAGRQGPNKIQELATDGLTEAAVVCFASGAFLSVFVGAFGYLVQVQHRHVIWASFLDDRLRERRNAIESFIRCFRALGFICGAVSLVLFLVAATCIYYGLRKHL
jgi:hypothetical protein